MWAISVALFFAFKALSWNRPWRELSPAWLLLWPGMEPEPFLHPGSARQGSEKEFVWAAAKTAFGALLLWDGGRWAMHAAHSPWLAGWPGMIGLLLLLHFGSFDLLALFWRARGVHAQPIMREPAAARSLGEFWGSRWNRAFSTVLILAFSSPVRWFPALWIGKCSSPGCRSSFARCFGCTAALSSYRLSPSAHSRSASCRSLRMEDRSLAAFALSSRSSGSSASACNSYSMRSLPHQWLAAAWAPFPPVCVRVPGRCVRDGALLPR